MVDEPRVTNLSEPAEEGFLVIPSSIDVGRSKKGRVVLRIDHDTLYGLNRELAESLVEQITVQLQILAVSGKN